MRLFGKSKIDKNATSNMIISEKQKIELKHSKPKILFVDLPQDCTEALISKGFNVQNGTFGKPYKVPKSSNYIQVLRQNRIPNQSEQEIIVIDLLNKEPYQEPRGEQLHPETELDFWAKCDKGIIDTRVVSALSVYDDFNRTLISGGVFVVFLDKDLRADFVQGRTGRMHGSWQLMIEQELNLNVLSFLEPLEEISILNDDGQEITVLDKSSPLGRLLNDHISNGKFTCTVSSKYRGDQNWQPIALNKHNNPVALERKFENGSWIILLPQIANKAEFLQKLITSVLPDTYPKLFPTLEKGNWCHREEYELTSILEVLEEKENLEQETKRKLIELEQRLISERKLNGWIHDLLTGTGDQLVWAVEKALNEIGFQNVVDGDKDRDSTGKSRREDLQIVDNSPLLIIDVKGISNFPSDEDALQAAKHAMIRMKELNRTDIESLSIINHQRHLPPLERDNTMPFRQEIIDAAETQYQGLMTSWDLYRILINKRKLGWQFKDVMPIFYRNGRCSILPENYQFIGKVVKVWTDKFGLIIEQNELNVGDKISIEFPVEFIETTVTSIFVSDANVNKAKIADKAGLQWLNNHYKLREGMSVFKVT
jgi:hypothetical protein